MTGKLEELIAEWPMSNLNMNNVNDKVKCIGSGKINTMNMQRCNYYN